MRTVHLPADRQFDDVRREMLRNSQSDSQLFAAIQALDRHGHSAWLIREIRAGLKATSPYDRALAITAAGFLNASAGAEKLWNGPLAKEMGPGWLSEVQTAARQWWERVGQMRHWGLQALHAEDEVTAWAAYRLFVAVADDRQLAWWGKPPYSIGHSWRSQWINLDSTPRRTQRQDRRKPLGESWLHTDQRRETLPPRS